MIRVVLVWLLSMWVAVVGAQNNSCSTATPYIDNLCAFLSPPSAGPITRCYTFTSPIDTISFDFVSFVPLGTCTDAVEWYELYDNACNSLSASDSGDFGGLIPGFQYVVCYNIQCPTDGVVNLICTSETAALPVELLYFTARSTPQGVDLLWSTASERDCMGFVIYRSTDLSSWVDVGFVEGSTLSTTTLNYKLTDNSPVTGINYYKLVQIDLDGAQETFQVIAIVWNQDQVGFNLPFRLFNFLGQRLIY